MLQPSFPRYPVLHTDRLILRQIRKEDAPDLLVLRSHDQIMRYLDRDKMTSTIEAEALIEKIEEAGTEGNGFSWAICFKDQNKMIGYAGIWRIDKANYRGEIGYTIHPEHWNRGLMSESLRVIIDFGFGPLGLHSLEANVNPENGASIRLLEKSGFVREAYFRENYYFRGIFLDSVIYSLLTPRR